MRYEYACPEGHQVELRRAVAERNDPATCTLHNLPLRRVFSVPTIHWPRNLWTQWSDLYDQSPREMAHDKSVERYVPDEMPNKPRQRVNLRPYVPQSQGEIERHMAEMARTSEPIPEEQPYV